MSPGWGREPFFLYPRLTVVHTGMVRAGTIGLSKRSARRAAEAFALARQPGAVKENRNTLWGQSFTTIY